jgi:hypothetical protein
MNRMARGAWCVKACALAFATPFLSCASFAGPPASTPTNAAPRHVLLFRNGDLIYGALHSIKPAEGLRWTHPDAAAPILFGLPHCAEAHLGSTAPPSARPQHLCHVRLVNGDELSGALVSLDESVLVLDTRFAGRLKLPRSRVRALSPAPEPGVVLYDGPTGLDGWTAGKVQGVADAGQWRFVNGAFVATQSASLARDVKLPDRASIEFEMAWRGTFNLAIALYTDSLQPVSLRAKENEPEFGAFYSLQLNNPVISLLHVTRPDPLRQLGQSIISTFNQTNRARIAIKTDRQQNLVALFADGALLKAWQDPENFKAKGTGIRFVHQGMGAIRIASLRVTEWDGRLEQPAQAAPDPGQDVARLVNLDAVAGELKGFRDGKLAILAGASTIEVALARVAQVEFASARLKPLAPEADESRLWFAQRGSVTARVETWDAQRAVLTSRVFGRVEIKPEAISRIQFAPLILTTNVQE